MYNLTFIKQEDFEKHVKNTIDEYLNVLKPIDLKKFNSNIIDPIKLLFDKKVQHKSYEEVIDNEIFRQRDKSDSNYIGYFHQNIFKYIKNCECPKEYWDVIYHGDVNYYVEMKNKHNTMNSSSAQKTYIKLLNQVVKEPECVSCLVEVIAKKSQNVPWNCTVDKNKVVNPHVRRISIDQFYKITTGVDDAFYKVCQQLPETIDKLIKSNTVNIVEDTVIQELKEKNPDILKSLYLLAFNTYEGFDKLI